MNDSKQKEGAVPSSLDQEISAILKRVDEDAKGTRCLTMAEVTLCLNALKRLARAMNDSKPVGEQKEGAVIKNADALCKWCGAAGCDYWHGYNDGLKEKSEVAHQYPENCGVPAHDTDCRCIDRGGKHPASAAAAPAVVAGMPGEPRTAQGYYERFFAPAREFVQKNGYADWDGTANGQVMTLTACANMLGNYMIEQARLAAAPPPVPAEEPDFGTAEEVLDGLDRIIQHNKEVQAEDSSVRPPSSGQQSGDSLQKIEWWAAMSVRLSYAKHVWNIVLGVTGVLTLLLSFVYLVRGKMAEWQTCSVIYLMLRAGVGKWESEK